MTGLPEPTPGSPEAVKRGCNCPIIDNAHGRGYMGGARDKDGNLIFVTRADCQIHGEKTP